MDTENLIKTIEFIHKDFIHSAIESVKADEREKEENKRLATISNFNIKNIDNLSLLCRNKLYMKKYYDDATPVENRHNRTLGNNELVGAFILSSYELDLYNPLSKDEENSDNQGIIIENSILNIETQNFLNLFLSIFTTLEICKKNNINLEECCIMLQQQYKSNSCVYNLSHYYNWFINLFSRKKKYEYKYLKYKKKYIELKSML